jgi:hypothetical protein
MKHWPALLGPLLGPVPLCIVKFRSLVGPKTALCSTVLPRPLKEVKVLPPTTVVPCKAIAATAPSNLKGTLTGLQA